MGSNSKISSNYRTVTKEKPLENANLIQIGSKVHLQLTFSKDDFEDYFLTITSNPSDVLSNGLLFVEAPLAQCILGKENGFVGEYRVNDSKIKVAVLALEN